VILEDDEMNTPSIRAAAMLASADIGIESSLELKKPTSHVNQEAWYDIEYGCYVLKDCPLPLENDGLAPVLAEDNHPLLELLQDATTQYSDGNTQCPSEEPGADTLPQPRCEDSEHDCGESVSELEKDMLQTFKEQENLSSANMPSSPHPQYLIPELVQPQIGQEPGQSRTNIAGLEELTHGSTQAEERELQEQQQ
jgi:hypothetical protein